MYNFSSYFMKNEVNFCHRSKFPVMFSEPLGCKKHTRCHCALLSLDTPDFFVLKVWKSEEKCMGPSTCSCGHQESVVSNSQWLCGGIFNRGLSICKRWAMRQKVTAHLCLSKKELIFFSLKNVNIVKNLFYDKNFFFDFSG